MKGSFADCQQRSKERKLAQLGRVDQLQTTVFSSGAVAQSLLMIGWPPVSRLL